MPLGRVSPQTGYKPTVTHYVRPSQGAKGVDRWGMHVRGPAGAAQGLDHTAFLERRLGNPLARPTTEQRANEAQDLKRGATLKKIRIMYVPRMHGRHIVSHLSAVDRGQGLGPRA